MNSKHDAIIELLPLACLVCDQSKAGEADEVTTTQKKISIAAFNTNEATLLQFYKHCQRIINIDETPETA